MSPKFKNCHLQRSTVLGDKLREAASSFTSYANTSFIHITRHRRSLLYGAGIVWKFPMLPCSLGLWDFSLLLTTFFEIAVYPASDWLTANLDAVTQNVGRDLICVTYSSSCLKFINLALTDLFLYFILLVPRRGPYLYNWNMNVRDHSITFTRENIRPEDAQGTILGYNITYVSLNEPNASINTMKTDTNTTTITLSNLKEGSTYIIGVAGFTRKGTGEYYYAAVTRKFWNNVTSNVS